MTWNINICFQNRAVKKINQRLFKRLILYYNVGEGNLPHLSRNPPQWNYPTTRSEWLSIEENTKK